MRGNLPSVSHANLGSSVLTGIEDAGSAPMLVDRREAAQMLGVSPGTIDNLRNTGELPSLKIRNRRLFDVEDLRKFIDHRKEVKP